jgi:hypothetical protein
MASNKVVKIDYGKDAPFADPVMRCDACKKVIRTAAVHQQGGCPLCGNRRVGNVMAFNLREYLLMRVVWRIDKSFLARFGRKAV